MAVVLPAAAVVLPPAGATAACAALSCCCCCLAVKLCCRAAAAAAPTASAAAAAAAEPLAVLLGVPPCERGVLTPPLLRLLPGCDISGAMSHCCAISRALFAVLSPWLPGLAAAAAGLSWHFSCCCCCCVVPVRGKPRRGTIAGLGFACEAACRSTPAKLLRVVQPVAAEATLPQARSEALDSSSSLSKALAAAAAAA